MKNYYCIKKIHVSYFIMVRKKLEYININYSFQIQIGIKEVFKYIFQ